ncbi:MAG TPA: DUF2800 domain-containing protein [Rhizobium sp.]|nr:DUF2800 domain-containing protein [Rhizobium sp.]
MSEHHGYTLDDIAAMAASGHSAFSPSSSKMWLTCSGSLIPNILADDDAGKEAAEGAVAHHVGETWLKHGRKAARKLIGTEMTVDGWTFTIDEEMLGFVAHYVQWCREIEEEAVEALTETRVDFSDLTPIPNQKGTADHIAIVEIDDELFNRQGDRAYEIVVTDLKYGKGVRVYAEGNTQAQIYAYGAWRIYRKSYNIQRVRIRIAHPRLTDGFSEWVISIGELLDFALNTVKPRAHAAWRFNAPRTASEEGCLWCKIKQTCPAAYKLAAEVTSGVFDDDDDEDMTVSTREMAEISEAVEDDFGDAPFNPGDPSKLSTKALAKILRHRSFVEKFFGAVEAELMERAIAYEEDIPGWKLVEGRTQRRWPDDDVFVYRKLKKLGLKDGAIFVESMISPAQAETKLVAKAGLSKDAAAKIVNTLAIKPPGPKSLVRVSDKRAALPSDGSVFDDDED